MNGHWTNRDSLILFKRKQLLQHHKWRECPHSADLCMQLLAVGSHWCFVLKDVSHGCPVWHLAYSVSAVKSSSVTDNFYLRFPSYVRLPLIRRHHFGLKQCRFLSWNLLITIALPITQSVLWYYPVEITLYKVVRLVKAGWSWCQVSDVMLTVEGVLYAHAVVRASNSNFHLVFHCHSEHVIWWQPESCWIHLRTRSGFYFNVFQMTSARKWFISTSLA